MLWTNDKIQHYKTCYNIVSKTPKKLRKISAIIVMIGGITKEIIDLTGCGTPEFDDIKANYLGVIDAIQGKTNRFKWEAQVSL